MEIWKKGGKKPVCVRACTGRDDVVVSYNEKQAIGNMHEDLLPKINGNSMILREKIWNNFTIERNRAFNRGNYCDCKR
ncbi:MAG: hypothetical protein GXO71_00545 [Caldiserica bacterium]|nr:hypothetical protein [Caldisericota bacterium]